MCVYVSKLHEDRIDTRWRSESKHPLPRLSECCTRLCVGCHTTRSGLVVIGCLVVVSTASGQSAWSACIPSSNSTVSLDTYHIQPSSPHKHTKEFSHQADKLALEATSTFDDLRKHARQAHSTPASADILVSPTRTCHCVTTLLSCFSPRDVLNLPCEGQGQRRKTVGFSSHQ